ncbi:hypothetical protein ABIE56_000398 [Luteibacter sp. 621]|uniref:hypothetical protein n=1 Tax=Luteibacter sp. 621 TaxID=3373916 RepID=UPI003D1ADF5D
MASIEEKSSRWSVTNADLTWAEAWRPPARPVRRECIDCIHFEPDTVNPKGGLGRCGKRPGLSVFPGVDMRCSQYSGARLLNR